MKALPKLGRPVSAKRAARKRPAEAAQPVAPLAVMLATMNWYHNQAEALGAELDDLVVALDDPANVKQAADLVKQYVACRQKALEAARDAAPYVHGKVVAGEPPPEFRSEPSPIAPPDSFMTTPATDADAKVRRYLRVVGGHDDGEPPRSPLSEPPSSPPGPPPSTPSPPSAGPPPWTPPSSPSGPSSPPSPAPPSNSGGGGLGEMLGREPSSMPRPAPNLPDVARDADGRPMPRRRRGLSQDEVDRRNAVAGTGEWLPRVRRHGQCFFD